MPGQLEVDGRAVPVEFVLRRMASGGHTLLAGRLSATLEALGVAVPPVGGELVAVAGERLDLFVQVRPDCVMGGEGFLDQTAISEASAGGDGR